MTKEEKIAYDREYRSRPYVIARRKERRAKTNRSEYMKKYSESERGKEKSRIKTLRKYNVTLAGYNKMFSDQSGKCAICGIHQTELERSLCVDHCHKTNKVRGLLCNNCNSGIGKLKDSTELLEIAIAYINKYKK